MVFCLLLNVQAFADCDILWSEVTMTIDCEGNFDFSIDNKDVDTILFAGTVGGSQTTFWPIPVVHATKTYASGSTFYLEIICNDGSKDPLTGMLPSYNTSGMGAGTYSFTGADGAGVPSGPTAVPTGGSITLSSSIVNPTCAAPATTNTMDGSISITVNGNVNDKCEGALVDVVVAGVTKRTALEGTVVFTGLGPGDYSAVATVVSTGCPCMLGTIATLTPIPLRGPTVGTTSLACNAQVNISVSQTCEATIMVTDLLRGVTDPCDPMLATIDSIVIMSGGVFVGGSGGPGSLGVTVDAQDMLGLPLTVQVIDEDSGNLCWGTVVLEDKSAPLVTCNDPGLMEILCLDFDGSVLNTIDDLIIDCSEATPTILAQSDINDCERLEQGILRRVEITYFAEDIFGNRSNVCVDTLDVLRFDTIPGNDTLDVPGNIIMPPAFVEDPKAAPIVTMIEGNQVTWPADSLPLTCTGNYARLFPDDPSNPAPAPTSIAEGGSGSPYLLFINEDGFLDTTLLAALNFRNADVAYKTIIDRNLANCNMAADFEDLIFDFGCKIKIQRQWFLREWSCPISQGGDEEQVLNLGLQEIIVTDFVAPEFTDPVDDMTFTVDADQCSRFVNIPKPVVFDSCDTDVDLEFAIFDMDGNLIGPSSTNGIPNMFFDFPTGMSFIVYTAFDDCGNQASDTTKVTVRDDTPPVVICKEFLVVGISGDGDVRLPVTSIDNGTFDQCSLDRICVTRMDDLNLLESLDANNDGEVLFSIFDDALQARADAGDGCYRDFSSSSFERGGRFYISTETICTPYVDFCCADVNNQGDDGIMVEVTAVDMDGNSNRCWTFVELQDKNPAVITCLPRTINIDCNFVLPEFDLTYDDIADDPLSQYFGSIVPQGQQKSFGIPDEFILGPANAEFVDGTIFDNCSIPRISVRITPQINSCNSGRIIRDLFSNETGTARFVCRQIINIQQNSNLIDSLLFLGIEDVTLEGCMIPEQLINESFGSPNIDDVGGRCSQLAVSTENQLFLFNSQDQESDACFKLVRTFTVIDWCQSTPGNPFVVGTHVQIIKVNDPDAPTITCADDLTGPNSVEVNGCDGGEVMLMATAFDECTEGSEHMWTGRVELDRDGDGIFETFDNDIIIIANATGDFTSKAVHTGFYPLGTHRITWTVTDRCGNIQSCVQNFTIINTKKPTPFAIDISTVLMNTGPMVEVWAADLDNGKSEGPCGQPLSMSIVRVSDVGNRTDGGFGISTPALTFTCNDVGDDGIDVNYFVFFEAGGNFVFDFTTVNIRIQDNNNVCNSVTSAFVSGNIHSESRESLPNITVDIKSMDDQSAAAIESSLTNERGDYAFPAMPQGGAYTIDPSSTDDYLNGVSTLDLVLIQRYILGITTFDSPYRILAADINNDRSITAIDLVELRSVILGYKESFTNNESWRFIDENYQFFDPEFPLDDNLTGSYDISSLESNTSIDFIGFKVGDVNGTVDAASILAHSRSNYNLIARDRSFKPGETVNLAVRASDLINTVGMQMSIVFNTDALAFTGIDANGLEIGREHIGYTQATEGSISISWSDVVSHTMATGEELFTLQFRAKRNGKLSDLVALDNSSFESEIYNQDLDIAQLSLVYNDNAEVGEFVLQQNVPNPFAENTLISFYLPNAAEATLTITDITGRTIKNITGSFDKGNNYINVRSDELATSGVLYYTVATEEFTDTKRMVVLK